MPNTSAAKKAAEKAAETVRAEVEALPGSPPAPVRPARSRSMFRVAYKATDPTDVAHDNCVADVRIFTTLEDAYGFAISPAGQGFSFVDVAKGESLVEALKATRPGPTESGRA